MITIQRKLESLLITKVISKIKEIVLTTAIGIITPLGFT